MIFIYCISYQYYIIFINLSGIYSDLLTLREWLGFAVTAFLLRFVGKDHTGRLGVACKVLYQ